MRTLRQRGFAFGWLMLLFTASFAARAIAQTNSTTPTTLPARSFLGMGGITTTPKRKASPKFSGKEIPLPPQQNARWIAPANSFPPSYVSAVALLFSQGMADPRGCEYREVEIGTGEAWGGDGGVAATHGWVLPGSGAQRFAVCWNGLVYPVVSIGKAADLAADVGAAVQKVGWNWRSALPERYTTSHETCLALKGCLLLRLGEVELAKQMWSAAQLGQTLDLNRVLEAPKPDPQQVKLSDADPYLPWASDWAWGVFDRAVCAHMRGDDGLALATARLLAGARPKLEATAKQRDFKRRTTHTSPWDGKYLDHVDFLLPLPVLLADQERRERRKVRVLSLPEIAKLPDAQARIGALIERLEEVAVRQWGQPGGLGLWETDPVIVALQKEGKPAIERLLEFLEQRADGQLTRSVSFGRDFHRGRSLHSVKAPVARLLLILLEATYSEVGFYGQWTSEASARLPGVRMAEMFRKYWEAFGSVPLPDRWYRKLADDQAGGAWADALRNLVRIEKIPGKTNETRFAGESLRIGMTPSVTELIVKRTATMTQGANHAFQRNDALAFLLDAEKWAGRAILPVAVDFQDRTMAAYTGRESLSTAEPLNAKAIAALATLRARHTDALGLDRYVQWVTNALPGVLDNSALEVLEPFWIFPHHPSIRAAAKAMFADPQSLWGTLAWLLDAPNHLSSSRPLATPILIVPEFRTLVLAELAKRSSAGEAVYRGGGNLDVNYANGRRTGYGARKDLEAVPSGTKFTFRRCDMVAEQLAAIPGFPSFSLLWSEQKRDEAVTATVELLKMSGDRLRIREKPPGWSSAFDPPLVELGERPK